MRWRTYLDGARSGAENMAIDEALMSRARRSGDAVLRLYAWDAPTLSLGRNQDAREHYDVERALALGVRFVRRPTGGRAVLHDREITYSVTAPVDAMGALSESYARINRLLLETLRGLGVHAEIADAGGRAMRPGTAPCFERPSAGEIMAGARKLVGSAQWRDGGALLQHGSILMDDDQMLSCELLRAPHEAPPPAATLGELLGRRPSLDEAHAQFQRAIRMLEDPDATPLVLDDETRCVARRLVARYEDSAWTWRR